MTALDILHERFGVEEGLQDHCAWMRDLLQEIGIPRDESQIRYETPEDIFEQMGIELL